MEKYIFVKEQKYQKDINLLLDRNNEILILL